MDEGRRLTHLQRRQVAGFGFLKAPLLPQENAVAVVDLDVVGLILQPLQQGLLQPRRGFGTCLRRGGRHFRLAVAGGHQLGQFDETALHPLVIHSLPAAARIGLVDGDGFFLEGIGLLLQQHLVLLQGQLVDIRGALGRQQVGAQLLVDHGHAIGRQGGVFLHPVIIGGAVGGQRLFHGRFLRCQGGLEGVGQLQGAVAAVGLVREHAGGPGGQVERTLRPGGSGRVVGRDQFRQPQALLFGLAGFPLQFSHPVHGLHARAQGFAPAAGVELVALAGQAEITRPLIVLRRQQQGLTPGLGVALGAVDKVQFGGRRAPLLQRFVIGHQLGGNRAGELVLRVLPAEIHQQAVGCRDVSRLREVRRGVVLGAGADSGRRGETDHPGELLRRLQVLAALGGGLALAVNAGGVPIHDQRAPVVLAVQQGQGLAVGRLCLGVLLQLKIAVPHHQAGGQQFRLARLRLPVGEALRRENGLVVFPQRQQRVRRVSQYRGGPGVTGEGGGKGQFAVYASAIHLLPTGQLLIGKNGAIAGIGCLAELGKTVGDPFVTGDRGPVLARLHAAGRQLVAHFGNRRVIGKTVDEQLVVVAGREIVGAGLGVPRLLRPVAVLLVAGPGLGAGSRERLGGGVMVLRQLLDKLAQPGAQFVLHAFVRLLPVGTGDAEQPHVALLFCHDQVGKATGLVGCDDLHLEAVCHRGVREALVVGLVGFGAVAIALLGQVQFTQGLV